MLRIILPGDHHLHPRQGLRFAGIHADDPGVGIGAAFQLGVQQPWTELDVVYELGRTGHFVQRVKAGDVGTYDL